MNTNIEKEYAYLWNGLETGWVLLVSESSRSGFSIYNKDNRTLLHIENSEICIEVCEKMRKAGVKVIKDMPVGEVQLEPVD